MSEGILNGTMANMSWVEVEQLASQNALVLLPLGVIEEHGPQLCLGTDIYIAHIHSQYLKEKLEQAGYKVVIAPPVFWGVCQATRTFIGSFRIRRETATALIIDIAATLAEFGFKHVFGVNAHGDIDHQLAIIEAFKEASEKYHIDACLPFPEQLIPHYGLKGDEPYICPVKPQLIKVGSTEYPDVHGGDIETATMNHFYPHLTNVETAKTLPPTRLGEDRIFSWLFGGQTKTFSEGGYLGAPSEYESVPVVENIEDITGRVSQAIIERVARVNLSDSAQTS